MPVATRPPPAAARHSGCDTAGVTVTVYPYPGSTSTTTTGNSDRAGVQYQLSCLPIGGAQRVSLARLRSVPRTIPNNVVSGTHSWELQLYEQTLVKGSASVAKAPLFVAGPGLEKTSPLLSACGSKTQFSCCTAVVPFRANNTRGVLDSINRHHHHNTGLRRFIGIQASTDLRSSTHPPVQHLVRIHDSLVSHGAVVVGGRSLLQLLSPPASCPS
eukprot:2651178-Rhodomonas_salina.2